jgi:chorismate synthase
MEKLIVETGSNGDSVGGMVKLEIMGVPVGLGDPVFGKLNVRLGAALLSIGGVKGIEFGAGFSVSNMFGSENNDQMVDGKFISNNAGGILGGISTGQVIEIKLAVKPTPSIRKTQMTSTINGENTELSVQGRHDPCIVPRIIPVVESMAALVILDALEMQSRLRPDCLNN